MSEFSIEDTLKAIETAQYAPPPLEVISPRDYNLADYSYEVILEIGRAHV